MRGALALLLLLAGCGQTSAPMLLTRGDVPAAKPPPLPTGDRMCGLPTWSTTWSQVATVNGPSINVSATPGGPPIKSFANPNERGVTRTFLVSTVQDQWAQVMLPTRPNGSMGWIRVSDVTMSQHDYRIQVQLSARRLTAWKGDQLIEQDPVAVGTGGTPTPCGQYYVTEHYQPPNPGGPYGPWMLALSAHSDVYYSFGGGDGLVALHGTNQPGLLGGDVSHGCVRVNNAAITRLAQTVPDGTPVEIIP